MKADENPGEETAGFREFAKTIQENYGIANWIKIYLFENMRKMRDDATWNQLSPEDRETVEDWLFEENLGYAKTAERAKAELGLEITIASLGRFYRRRARERQVAELLQAQETANALNELPINAESLRSSAIKLVGKSILQLAADKPDEIGQLVSLTRLLLESEENDIRRSRLKLAERYFHYEATEAARKDLPQLVAYLSAIEDDEGLDHDAKLERVRAIMFPGRPPLESARASYNSEPGGGK